MQRYKQVANALGLAACLPLAACYPVYKTLQPRAEVLVENPQGEPLSQAEVALISNAYPRGTEQSRTYAVTAENGAARFSRISEWRLEFLMVHGWQEYFWNWCVKKNGYKTFTTTYSSDGDFTPLTKVALEPGESSACPPPR